MEPIDPHEHHLGKLARDHEAGDTLKLRDGRWLMLEPANYGDTLYCSLCDTGWDRFDGWKYADAVFIRCPNCNECTGYSKDEDSHPVYWQPAEESAQPSR